MSVLCSILLAILHISTDLFIIILIGEDFKFHQLPYFSVQFGWYNIFTDSLQGVMNPSVLSVMNSKSDEQQSCGPWSDGNEVVIHTPQRSRSEAAPSDTV